AAARMAGRFPRGPRPARRPRDAHGVLDGERGAGRARARDAARTRRGAGGRRWRAQRRTDAGTARGAARSRAHVRRDRLRRQGPRDAGDGGDGLHGPTWRAERAAVRHRGRTPGRGGQDRAPVPADVASELRLVRTASLRSDHLFGKWSTATLDVAATWKDRVDRAARA